jgi:hypothetical protein
MGKGEERGRVFGGEGGGCANCRLSCVPEKDLMGFNASILLCSPSKAIWNAICAAAL